MDKESSTLIATETRLAPAVLVIQVLCAVEGIAFLGMAFAHANMFLLATCAFAWLFPTVLNVYYLLRNSRPSVGMIPPSLVSLGPAALPLLLTQNTMDAFGLLAIAASVVSGATASVMLFWFHRLRAAYAHAPHVPANPVVIVLGGAIKQGRPSKTLALRLNIAAQLWHQYPHATFVLTGSIPANEHVSEADAMAAYLKASGVPTHNMLLETHAQNTRENLSFSLELVRAKGIPGKLCVLSSDYHLYRSVRIGRALGVELMPIPAPTPRGSWLQQWCREALTIMASHLK